MSGDDERGVWSYRNFRYLFAARVADIAGNAIAPVALAFAVLDLTGSASDLGLVVASRSAALIALLLLGGVLADRWPRSIVLVWSNVVSATTQAVVAVLVLSGNASISLLIGLSILNGGAAAISFPAAGALITETVPKALLQQANATVWSGTTFVNLGGLVAGAALVATVGPGWGLVVDSISFALTAVFFSRLRIEATPAAADKTLLGDLREGWQTVIDTTWIWTVVLGFLVLNVAYSGAITVLGPVVADDSIGRAAWGWVLGCQAAGMLLATVTLARLHRPVRLTIGLILSTLPAILVFALGASPRLFILAPAAVIAGIGLGTFSVVWETTLQANVAADQLSRVYSIDMVGSIGALPLGQVAVGPIALALGVDTTLIFFSLVFLLPAAILASLPAVRAVSTA